MAAGAAFAQAPSKELFYTLDLNGDGFVSLSEAAGEAVIVQRFDRADRDRDGKLSSREFASLNKVKVRTASSRRGEDRSAATGSSARKPYTAEEKKAAEGG